MDNSTITIALGVLAAFGASLATAVGIFWRWVTKQLDDCKSKHDARDLLAIEQNKSVLSLTYDFGVLKGEVQTLRETKASKTQMNQMGHKDSSHS
jgi:hypothetical protein